MNDRASPPAVANLLAELAPLQRGKGQRSALYWLRMWLIVGVPRALQG